MRIDALSGEKSGVFLFLIHTNQEWILPYKRLFVFGKYFIYIVSW